MFHKTIVKPISNQNIYAKLTLHREWHEFINADRNDDDDDDIKTHFLDKFVDQIHEAVNINDLNFLQFTSSFFKNLYKDRNIDLFEAKVTFIFLYYLVISLEEPEYFESFAIFIKTIMDNAEFQQYKIEMSLILTENVYKIFNCEAYTNCEDPSEVQSKFKLLIPYCLPYTIDFSQMTSRLNKDVNDSDESPSQDQLTEGELSDDQLSEKESSEEETVLSLLDFFEPNESDEEALKLMIDNWYRANMVVPDKGVAWSFLDLGDVLFAEHNELYLRIIPYIISKADDFFYNNEFKKEVLFYLLSKAAERKYLDAVRLLLDHGVTHELPNKNDNLLIYCARNNDLDFVKIILEKRPELINQPYLGITPLVSAILGEHVEIIRYLLSLPQIDVNAYVQLPKAANDYSAFGFALVSANPEIIEIFLQNKHVNKHAITSNGHSSLDVAINTLNLPLFERLIKEYDVTNKPDDQDQTPIEYCLEGIKTVIEKKEYESINVLFKMLICLFENLKGQLTLKENNLIMDVFELIKRKAEELHHHMSATQFHEFGESVANASDKFATLARKYKKKHDSLKKEVEKSLNRLKKHNTPKNQKTKISATNDDLANSENDLSVITRNMKSTLNDENLKISFRNNFLQCKLNLIQATAFKRYLKEVVQIDKFQKPKQNNIVHFRVTLKGITKQRFIDSFDKLPLLYTESVLAHSSLKNLLYPKKVKQASQTELSYKPIEETTKHHNDVSLKTHSEKHNSDVSLQTHPENHHQPQTMKETETAQNSKKLTSHVPKTETKKMREQRRILDILATKRLARENKKKEKKKDQGMKKQISNNTQPASFSVNLSKPDLMDEGQSFTEQTSPPFHQKEQTELDITQLNESNDEVKSSNNNCNNGSIPDLITNETHDEDSSIDLHTEIVKETESIDTSNNNDSIWKSLSSLPLIYNDNEHIITEGSFYSDSDHPLFFKNNSPKPSKQELNSTLNPLAAEYKPKYQSSSSEKIVSSQQEDDTSYQCEIKNNRK